MSAKLPIIGKATGGDAGATMSMSRRQLSDTPIYSIGTAGRMLGVSVHTLRMYERSGLIVPRKSKGNQRLYSDMDIDRIRCIRNSIRVQKISIQGIRKVLSLIPCWVIAGCPEKDRAACPAYNGDSGPCWAAERKGAFCRQRECHECEAYREFGNCASVKERLKLVLRKDPTEYSKQSTS